MAATISGSVLASLFYDNSNSQGDQEGLLFGSVESKVKDTISDSQINNYEVQITTYVYSYYTQDKSHKFYDRACRLDAQQIRAVTPDDHQLIGWYSFRRNTSARPSLKEQNLHHNFLSILPDKQRNNFLFLLCTGSPTENFATHNFDFDFLIFNKSQNSFDKVPLCVLNLGDTLHSEYKYDTILTSGSQSGRLNKVMTSHQSHTLNKNGQPAEAENIKHLSESLLSSLKDLAELVIKSENRLQILQTQIQKGHQVLKERSNSHNQDESTHIPLHKSVTSHEEAVHQAKLKREQKRRDVSNSSSRGRYSSDSSHSRRLSNNEDLLSSQSILHDGPSPPYSRKLSTENYDWTSSENHAKDVLLPMTAEKVQTDSGKDEILEEKNSTEESSDIDPASELSSSQEIIIREVDTSSSQFASSPQSSDPFSFVEGVIAQARSKQQNVKTDVLKNDDDLAKKSSVQRGRNTEKGESAIKSDERKNTNKTKQTILLDYKENEKPTTRQSSRSRSRENMKGSVHDSFTQNNIGQRAGNCGMEANSDVTIVTSDSDDNSTLRPKEESFEMSSSPVY